MHGANLSDLVAAHRAYAHARLRAIKSAAPGVGPIMKLQHQALADYLQARVRVLTDARSRAIQRYDADIGKCHEKIGQLHQLLQGDSGADLSAEEAAAVNVASKKKGPKKGN